MEASLGPRCQSNLENSVYEEIHRDREKNGLNMQEPIDNLHRRINELENRLNVALRVIDRDFVRGKKENEQ